MSDEMVVFDDGVEEYRWLVRPMGRPKNAN